MTPEELSALSLFDTSVTLDHFRGVGAEIEVGEKRRWIDRTLDWCARHNATILHPMHAGYPSSFSQLEAPPLFLSCRGEMPWLTHHCLSIVGSREPTADALEWMETHLPSFLSRPDIAVVSGGARGVDQKAHVLSIRARRPTVVFLPSGLDCVYPPEARSWIGAALDGGGCVVSLHAPWQEVRRSHFEARNHLIAAMGRAVFVVEARKRSGSIMTARLARDLGRPISALPSAPGQPRSAGTLDLIVDGECAILRDASDLQVFFELSAAGAF